MSDSQKDLILTGDTDLPEAKSKKDQNDAFFEKSLLKVIERAENRDKLVGFDYIPAEFFIEDYEEEAKEELISDNIKLENLPALEKAVRGTFIDSPNYDKSGKSISGSHPVLLTDQDVILAIHENKGLKRPTAKALGISVELLRFYLGQSRKLSEELQTALALHLTHAKKKPEDKTISKAIFKSRGNLAMAARILTEQSGTNIGRSTLKNWIDKSAFLRDKLEEVKETDLDYAESKRDELIDGIMVKGYDGIGRPVVYEQAPDLRAIEKKLKAKGRESDSVTVNKNVTGKIEHTITGMRIL